MNLWTLLSGGAPAVFVSDRQPKKDGGSSFRLNACSTRKNAVTKMEASADSASFPNANRVVRVAGEDWKVQDDDLLSELSDVIHRRVAGRRHPSRVEAYLQPPPRVLCGNSHVYLLYGQRPIWVDEANQIQCDFRGLVFEPLVRISSQTVVVNL